MRRKMLEELTIVDDFMFGAVMGNPERCKPLLEMIFNKKIARIEFPEVQKAIMKRFDYKSVRLDVYMEDDLGTVYYVIFICTFDPFRLGRYFYTFENRCIEAEGLSLGDDSRKIFLNTVGTQGKVNEELKDVFDYMNGKPPKSSYTRQLDQEVKEIKADENWRIHYMKLLERDRLNRKLGVRAERVRQARTVRHNFSTKQLAMLFLTTPSKVQEILDTIDAHPDWDDEDVAENIEF